MQLDELSTWLDTQLLVADFAKSDSAINGLQLGDKQRSVNKIAFAVDACLESFQLSQEWGADLLITHHGLFWGHQEPITDLLFKRIEFLCKHNLALYSSHLPLDRHPEFGNNAGLCAQLALTNLEPFGLYKGTAIGFKGTLPSPMKLEEISFRLFGDERGCLGQLPFGKTLNQTVGIISGGATMEVFQAISQKLDVYITGDSDHTIYHACQEAGINVLFGGHYQTEVWGVSLLAKKIKAELGIETKFFDIPTGL